MHKLVVLKKYLKFTLKFALKHLWHVSLLQLHHHQGGYDSLHFENSIITVFDTQLFITDLIYAAIPPPY